MNSFTVSQLEYDLPPERIAQHPLPRRDDSRMLVVERSSGTLTDSGIHSFPDYLRAGDLLVLNDTRVLPARFTAFRKTGGRIEGLFLEEQRAGIWSVMLERSRRLRAGQVLWLSPADEGVTISMLESLGEGVWRVHVVPSRPAEEILSRVGRTPLPPYIRRENQAEESDAQRYQTVYARIAGAVAAPTAGLHLTQHMLELLRGCGIEIAFVTLHVGTGTFKPIAADRLEDHQMHSERFEISESAANAWKQCRTRGGRVFAVGTTVVRVLETAFAADGLVQAQCGATSIFLYPPYRFRAVDALLTNFHLPRSTLLALVMAFAGVELTRKAYAHAVERQYRFYSYGDAMLVL